MIVYEKRIGEGQWKKIYGYLQEFTEIYSHSANLCYILLRQNPNITRLFSQMSVSNFTYLAIRSRRFVEGVFWMLCSGAQWWMIPATFGHWNTVYRRFAD